MHALACIFSGPIASLLYLTAKRVLAQPSRSAPWRLALTANASTLYFVPKAKPAAHLQVSGLPEKPFAKLIQYFRVPRGLYFTAAEQEATYPIHFSGPGMVQGALKYGQNIK
eukprot:1160356-Pelagomonas_calceolata.AAC.4